MTRTFYLSRLPEIIAFSIVIAVQIAFASVWVVRTKRADRARRRVWALYLLAASILLLVVGIAITASRVQRLVPRTVSLTVRGLAVAWAMASLGGVAIAALTSAIPRPRPDHSPSRRNFLSTVRYAAVGVPAVAAGYGVFIGRRDIRLKEVDVAVEGLPKDLEGLRIVQLTDIHLSPFLSIADLRRVVDMANETKAHLALITGDLITGHGDPLDDCIAELKRVRADAGALGCHGNHEVYAGCMAYATEQGARAGIDFLRSRSRILQFGSARINFAGVDYQRFRTPYLVNTERLIVPGITNVLLSHNPDVLPVAAQKGFDLTISGHTHGGQIAVEILNQDINFARFYTPYVYGTYRYGRSTLYVGRGIGTVGVPARLGAPPEVALIRLCAI